MLRTFFSYDRVVTTLAHLLCLLLVLGVILVILAAVAFVTLVVNLFWANPGYFLLVLAGTVLIGKYLGRDPSF